MLVIGTSAYVGSLFWIRFASTSWLSTRPVGLKAELPVSSITPYYPLISFVEFGILSREELFDSNSI